PTACLSASRMPHPPRRGSAAPSSGSRPSCHFTDVAQQSWRDSFKGLLTGLGESTSGPIKAAGRRRRRKPLRSFWRVQAQLNGCGTNSEHMVSVHDLFRASLWGPPQRGKCKMLTRKQFELLRFIHERLKETGVPPSFDEMKDALDLRSKSGIHRLI